MDAAPGGGRSRRARAPLRRAWRCWARTCSMPRSRRGCASAWPRGSRRTCANRCLLSCCCGTSAPAGTARGLAFALVEGLGAVTRRCVAKQVSALSPEDRRELARLGVSIGRLAVFLPALQNAAAMRLRARLFAVRRGLLPELGPEGLPSAPTRPLARSRLLPRLRLLPRRPARRPPRPPRARHSTSRAPLAHRPVRPAAGAGEHPGLPGRRARRGSVGSRLRRARRPLRTPRESDCRAATVALTRTEPSAGRVARLARGFPCLVRRTGRGVRCWPHGGIQDAESRGSGSCCSFPWWPVVRRAGGSARAERSLAAVPWAARGGRRGRGEAAGQVGRHPQQRDSLEDPDSRPGALEPGGVGRPGVRDDGDLVAGGRHLQAGPLRRGHRLRGR